MEYNFKKGASLQKTSPRPSSLLLEEGGREGGGERDKGGWRGRGIKEGREERDKGRWEEGGEWERGEGEWEEGGKRVR